MAWLLVICAIPYLGIPLYLFFSGRKFKYGLSGKAKIYSTAGRLEGSIELTSTQRILAASGVDGAKLNQSLELLPTGVTAYNRLIEIIHGAQTSIHITTFIFGNDPVGRAVVAALAERASAGIDVRVLVDSLGATLISHPSFAQFTSAGGKVAYFMPVLHLPFRGRTNLRNHRKLMVVDGTVAVLGGMNLAQEYMGPTEDANRWIDLGLQLKGACVGDLEKIFLQDWAYATHSPAPAIPVSVVASRTGEILAQVVASGPDVVGDPLYDLLFNAINEAKKSVWIVTPYFIPDESLMKALELAVKRGVAVHVIIPQASNHRMADLARGSFVRQLISVGVDFGFYPRMIHAKAFLVDGELAILGSANLDMRSLLLNYELGLVIYDSTTLRDVKEWIRQRHGETVQGLLKSGFWREIGEGIGRAIGPIL